MTTQKSILQQSKRKRPYLPPKSNMSRSMQDTYPWTGVHSYANSSYSSPSYSSPGMMSASSTTIEHDSLSAPLAGDARTSPARYRCSIPGCSKDFTRQTDLKRHFKTQHDAPNKRIDCDFKWCGRTGEHGFTRKDHLAEHLREVHRQNIPKGRNRRE